MTPRRFAYAAVFLATLSLWVPRWARAAEYNVFACGDAPNRVNNSWSPTNTAPQKLETAQGCDDAGDYGGLYARDVSDTSNAPAGSTAQWLFSAPPGTSIAAISYSRWLFKEDDDDWQPTLETDNGILDTCSIVYPAVRCESGTRDRTRVKLSVNGATTLTFGVRCAAASGSTCVNGALGHHAVDAVIYGATVSVADPQPPSLTSVDGALVESQYPHGTSGATFSATDNTGIRTGRIYVDGALAASSTYACDFTYAVPCSNKSDAGVSLDTRSLTDGPHSVQVAAVDPAGNETRSSSYSVVVDNNAPAAPGALSVDGGSGWRDFNSFDVSWANLQDSASPVASAHYALCAADGSGCLPEQETAATNISHLSGLSVPSPGAWALRVWLEDAAGNVDPTHASEVTLRYGADPDATMTPTVDAPSDSQPPARDSAPIVAEPLTAPSLATPSTSQHPAASRTNPHLRLTSARLTTGGLVLRGRSTARLPLALTIRLGNGHRLRRHTTIRAGQFKLVIRSRHLARNGLVTARFAGSSTISPARATVRVRG
jgi:hypothetical protein